MIISKKKTKKNNIKINKFKSSTKFGSTNSNIQASLSNFDLIDENNLDKQENHEIKPLSLSDNVQRRQNYLHQNPKVDYKMNIRERNLRISVADMGLGGKNHDQMANENAQRNQNLHDNSQVKPLNDTNGPISDIRSFKQGKGFNRKNLQPEDQMCQFVEIMNEVDGGNHEYLECKQTQSSQANKRSRLQIKLAEGIKTKTKQINVRYNEINYHPLGSKDQPQFAKNNKEFLTNRRSMGEQYSCFELKDEIQYKKYTANQKEQNLNHFKHNIKMKSFDLDLRHQDYYANSSMELNNANKSRSESPTNQLDKNLSSQTVDLPGKESPQQGSIQNPKTPLSMEMTPRSLIDPSVNRSKFNVSFQGFKKNGKFEIKDSQRNNPQVPSNKNFRDQQQERFVNNPNRTVDKVQFEYGHKIVGCGPRIRLIKRDIYNFDANHQVTGKNFEGKETVNNLINLSNNERNSSQLIKNKKKYVSANSKIELQKQQITSHNQNQTDDNFNNTGKILMNSNENTESNHITMLGQSNQNEFKGNLDQNSLKYRLSNDNSKDSKKQSESNI